MFKISTAIAAVMLAGVASTESVHGYRVAVECHGSAKELELGVWKGLEDARAEADNFFEERSDAGDVLCRPHSWEINISKR